MFKHLNPSLCLIKEQNTTNEIDCFSFHLQNVTLSISKNKRRGRSLRWGPKPTASLTSTISMQFFSYLTWSFAWAGKSRTSVASMYFLSSSILNESFGQSSGLVFLTARLRIAHIRAKYLQYTYVPIFLYFFAENWNSNFNWKITSNHNSSFLLYNLHSY